MRETVKRERLSRERHCQERETVKRETLSERERDCIGGLSNKKFLFPFEMTSMAFPLLYLLGWNVVFLTQVAEEGVKKRKRCCLHILYMCKRRKKKETVE